MPLRHRTLGLFVRHRGSWRHRIKVVADSRRARAALYVALTLLIIGHALFKPSTQRLLSAIYPTGGRRLEEAQILLYFTANLGAAAGSVLAGLLASYAGWEVTYSAAALLMSLGVLFLSRADPPPKDSPSSTETHDSLQTEPLPLPIPNRASIIAGLTLVMFLFSLCTAQVEGAILLWARDRVDPVLGGFVIPIA